MPAVKVLMRHDLGRLVSKIVNDMHLACLTRMHSSRMRTVRCSSRLLRGVCQKGVSASGGGVSAWKGVSAQGGVCPRGYSSMH